MTDFRSSDFRPGYENINKYCNILIDCVKACEGKNMLMAMWTYPRNCFGFLGITRST